MKIAITGPESSGKTSLAIALAKELGVSYVPEFARFYLQEKGLDYTQKDLYDMAQEQIKWWQRAGNDFVADTDLTVFRIWEEVKFQHPSNELGNLVYDFDLYILCKPDIPWESDPLREDEHDREELFVRYEKELRNNHLSFTIVEGNPTQRLQAALRFIQTEKGH